MIVAGAGLGGLTAAALFSREGFSTLVIEKLPRIGGRFMNIPYKGFQLTSGAFHFIPHKRGIVKRLLRREIKSDLEFIDAGPVPFIFDGSITDYILKVPAILDSAFVFSLGLKFRETPILESVKFMAKSLAAGTPSLPKGGCASIIQTLEKTVLDNKGEIITQTSVKGITIQECKVDRIILEKSNGSISTVKTSRLISDVGPKNTLKVLSDGRLKESFKHQLHRVKPTEGIKINIESSKPIINDIVGAEASILFTPSCERIAGIAEPSILDPDLAPYGKSLLMTAQQILSSNIKKEIQIGIKDLKRIIPNFKRNCRIIAVQVFKGDWPVNHARQGQDASQTTPIKGLYLVGDGAKPSGFIMAEGVVESARRVVDRVLHT